MKTHVIFCIVFLLTLVGSVFSENLILTGEEKVYFPYEPIYINISYTGSSDMILNKGSDDIRVIISNLADNTVRTFCSIEHYDRVCAECIATNAPLKPDEEISDVMNITCDAQGWLFERPGSYQVQVEKIGAELRSNPITIEIRAPLSEEDEQAFLSLRTCKQYNVFCYLEGGDMFEDAIATVKKIAQSNSTYRFAMRDLLVKNYSQQSCTKDGKLRQPDMDMILSFYDPSSNDKVGRYSKLRSLALIGRFTKGADHGAEDRLVIRETETLKGIYSGDKRMASFRLNRFVK